MLSCVQVYSQKNLKEMIASVESSLADGMPVSKSGSSSQMAAIVRQSINEFENPSFNYVPLFGQETVFGVRNLLSAVALAKANLKSVEPVEEKSHGLWSRIREWFMYSGPASPDENGEEAKKAINHLELASTQFAKFFDVSSSKFYVLLPKYFMD